MTPWYHGALVPWYHGTLAAMEPWWELQWGNPSSRQHRLGLTAAAAVSDARERLAHCLEVDPEQVVFTSGATEANNLALLGHARAIAERRGGRTDHLGRTHRGAPRGHGQPQHCDTA